jgi:2-desacetyl-2-hydroxyethyl bacteriochlorophyllide A dehydrogenase
MKALVYVAPGKVEFKTVPEPKPVSGHAKVRMKYCGICGGDLGIFAGTHPRAKAPLIIGHEFVGVIEEISDRRNDLKVGDRVVVYPLISCGHCLSCRTGIPHICRTLGLIGIDIDGGMAEYAYVDEDVLFKVDDTVSDKTAALIEPMAVVVRAIHRSGFKLLDSTLVMGAGAIGIITAILLKNAGASEIIISDMDGARLELCKELGFNTVNIKDRDLADVVGRLTDGEGVDIVFECSGTEAATFESTKLAKMGGTVCMTGIHKTPHVSNLPEFSFKEQKLVATRVYTKREFERSVAYAKEIGNELEKLVTHIVPLSRGGSAFDMIQDPNANTVKVLLDCTDIGRI